MFECPLIGSELLLFFELDTFHSGPGTRLQSVGIVREKNKTSLQVGGHRVNVPQI